MKPTQDYLDAVDGFVAQLSRSDSVEAAYLYGSVARGEIVLNHSDVDFWVFVKGSGFSDHDSFVHMMNNLVVSGKDLANRGLPDFHAFCYYSVSELNKLPAGLVPNLTSDRSSKLSLGNDLRPLMGSSRSSFEAHKKSYFVDMRRHVFLPLTPLLLAPKIDGKMTLYALGGMKYLKYTAEAICAALDTYPGELDAAKKVQELLGIDVSVIHAVENFRVNYDAEIDGERLPEMLELTLMFVEEAYEKLKELI